MLIIQMTENKLVKTVSDSVVLVGLSIWDGLAGQKGSSRRHSPVTHRLVS